MKKLLLIPAILFFSVPVSAKELYRVNVNKVCASIVGIPYASDNFTDSEWEQFKNCVDFMRKFEE